MAKPDKSPQIFEEGKERLTAVAAIGDDDGVWFDFMRSPPLFGLGRQVQSRTSSPSRRRAAPAFNVCSDFLATRECSRVPAHHVFPPSSSCPSSFANKWPLAHSSTHSPFFAAPDLNSCWLLAALRPWTDFGPGQQGSQLTHKKRGNEWA